MAIYAYTKSGSKKDGSVTLPKAIFGLEVNADLIAEAYQAYLNNGRSAGASTKTRGDVRGGGIKPHRQKGTGRARVGSSRVPNWRGGGVTFGPTGHENYTQNMPTKMKRQAIRQALSLQAKDGKVMVLESFDGGEGKVSATNNLLVKLGASGSILLVVDSRTDMIDRSTRNLAGLTTVAAQYLNVFDIMNADAIIMTQKSLEAIEQWLGEAKKAPKAVEAEETPEPKVTAKAAPKAKAGAAA